MGLGQRRIVADALARWMSEGRPCVLATVVSTTDSAPRGVGAQLAVTDGDLWVGGLSGGCAEVGVLHEARELLAGEDLVAAVHVTMTRDELGSAGPVCGATLGVLVERVDAELASLLGECANEAAAGRGAACERRYGVRPAPIDDAAAPDRVTLVRRSARACDADGGRALEWEPAAGGDNLLVERAPAAPRVVVGGAGDIACELIRAAGALGWRTALVDPRGSFVEQTLAQVQPDEVIRAWPDAAFDELDGGPDDAFVAAAHEERIDLPFLVNALRTDAFYVASVGSRVVQHERAAQLAEAVGSSRAAHHRGPAGLNLGGMDAAEIALSILAEALATRNGRSGAPLRESAEPIGAR
jgi:xanthine dehydrogenase accessory factor